MPQLRKFTLLLATVVAIFVCAGAYISLLVVQRQNAFYELSHWRFSALAAGLMLFGMALVVLLTWHNRMLRKAHGELHDLASDLKTAASELEAANRAIHDTNSELQQQNATLLMRDTQLQTQSERFQAALNNMSQGLCMVDPAQTLIVCNEQ